MHIAEKQLYDRARGIGLALEPYSHKQQEGGLYISGRLNVELVQFNKHKLCHIVHKVSMDLHVLFHAYHEAASGAQHQFHFLRLRVLQKRATEIRYTHVLPVPPSVLKFSRSGARRGC